MLVDPPDPGLQELLGKLMTFHIPFVISSLSGIAIGSAVLIQTLNSLIYAKVKATNELLDKELGIQRQKREDLERELNEMKERVKNHRELEEELAGIKNKLSALPTPVITKRRSPIKYIAIAATIAVLLTLLSVPLSRRLRQEIYKYSEQSRMDQQTIVDLTAQLKILSAPFNPSDVVRLVQSPKQRTKQQQELDGHAYDLDKMAERKFVYRGLKPAVFVGSNTSGLVVSATKGFVILIRPNQQH